MNSGETKRFSFANNLKEFEIHRKKLLDLSINECYSSLFCCCFCWTFLSWSFEIPLQRKYKSNVFRTSSVSFYEYHLTNFVIFSFLLLLLRLVLGFMFFCISMYFFSSLIFFCFCGGMICILLDIVYKQMKLKAKPFLLLSFAIISLLFFLMLKKKQHPSNNRIINTKIRR